LRPPWAGEEGAFLDACTSCGDCMTACPGGVLIEGEGGHPVFAPARGECTFCKACVDACEPRALDFGHADPPWGLKAQVAATCLTHRGVVCLSCRDACGEAAIRLRPSLGVARPELDSERCTGGGACVGVCPASALVISAPSEGRA
jgi:ferredoxin-type protein NapF